jgi:YfbU domain
MKLSRVERWILANQFRILERLVPDEAEGFLAARRAVESGFELVYETLAKHIAEPGLTSEECREVIDTRSMFEALAKANADTVPGVDAGKCNSLVTMRPPSRPSWALPDTSPRRSGGSLKCSTAAMISKAIPRAASLDIGANLMCGTRAPTRTSSPPRT